MTQRTNSNFYQIAKTDANGNVTGITISNVADLTIPGGTLGQVLTTDGAGNLSWGVGGGGGNTQPIIEFTANATGGAGQTFSDANIVNFASNAYAAVYLNGVLQQLADYTISGNTLTMNSTLLPNDVIAIGPMGGGDGTVTSIVTSTVDTSALGFTLSGGPITSSGTITLTVPNTATLLNSLGIPNIANVANYPALNGNATYYLTGAGTWVPGVTKGYLMATGGNLMPAPIHPANTTLAFDTVLCNSGGIAYNTSTGVLTLPSAGVYRLVATIQSTVSGDVYSSGDVTFEWRYATSSMPLIANTQTTADSYGAGATYVGTQATNELIWEANTAMTVRVATVYDMNNAMNDVNFVRLIVQQL